MGYLFLSIALFSGALKGYCGKKLGGYSSNTQSAVLLNLFRMVLCVLFGIAVIFLLGEYSHLIPAPTMLFICALSGVGTSVFVVSWLLAVRKSAYLMLDVFLMLGSLIPMILGYMLFAEPVTLKQWIGFAVLIVAVLILCSYNNTIKVKLSISSVLLLILCGLANGVADFSQKLFVKSFPNTPVSIFNLYTYCFAAITLIVIFCMQSRKEKACFGANASKTSLLYIVIMAIALAANSYFKTLAAVYLDSAKLYPINQGIALILSTLMATFFFKEKFTPKVFAGIVLTFIALMIINF